MSGSDSDDGGLAAELEAELLALEQESEEEETPRKRARTEAPAAEAADAAAAAPPVLEAPPVAPPADARGGLCPPHPGFLGGMCIRCCAHRSEEEEEAEAEAAAAAGTSAGSGLVPLTYLSSGLQVRAAVMEGHAREEAARCVSQRKLLLVLDLDHTLLNSARASDLDAPTLAALHEQTQREPQRPGGPQLYELRYCQLWTKLRPGSRELLREASALCEVLIYTMGDKGYAHEMARLLDPEGQLLRAGRLISAGDSTKGGLKSLDVVMGDARSCIVLDDSPGVWRGHTANVVVPDRYHFFPSSCLSVGEQAAGAHLPRCTDEQEPDGTLFAIMRMIRRVHAQFFAEGAGEGEAEPDVRALLVQQRKQVLSGCVLLFSAVIPKGMVPKAHALWQLGEALGAVCVVEVAEGGPKPTHLVASSQGTEKGRWADREGVPSVTPDWLRKSSARWERAPEAEFPLPPPPKA